MQHHGMLWDKFICLYCESGLIGNTTSSLKRTTHGIQIKRISYTTPPFSIQRYFCLECSSWGETTPPQPPGSRVVRSSTKDVLDSYICTVMGPSRWIHLAHAQSITSSADGACATKKCWRVTLAVPLSLTQGNKWMEIGFTWVR